MLPAEGSARPDARSDHSSAPAPSSEPVTDATLRIGSQELSPQAALRQASEDELASLARPSSSNSMRQAPQRTASGSSAEAASSAGGPRSSAGGGQQAPQQGQAGMSQPGPGRSQAAPHGERAARVQRVVPARLHAVPQAPPGGYTSLRIIGGKAVYVSHDGRQVSCRHARAVSAPWQHPPTLQEGLPSSALSQGVEQAKLDTSSGAWWNHQFIIPDCVQCIAASSLLSSCMPASLFHILALYCGLCRSLLALGRQDLTSSVAASPRQLTKRLVAHLDS